MAWSIVDVVLRDSDAVRGKSPPAQDLVRQMLEDGYEPFSTAGGPDGIVLSFRRYREGEQPTFDPAELPGQYR
jgi:hypothetical protein